MKKSTVALVCFSLSVIVLNSCTKSGSSNDSSNFIGKWVGPGTSTVNGVVQSSKSDTLVFVAGSDGNHVNIQPGGTGSCSGGTILSFVINASALSLPSTAVTDGCGQKYTMAGTGNLNGGTLAMNFQETIIDTVHGGSSKGTDTVIKLSAQIVLTLTKK